MTAKEAYQKKLAAPSRDWAANIATLQAKATQASADAPIGYENDIESFK